MKPLLIVMIFALSAMPLWAFSLEELEEYEVQDVPTDEYEQVEVYNLTLIRIFKGKSTGTRIICIDDMVKKEPFADNLAGTWNNERGLVKFVDKSERDGCWYYQIIPQK